MRGVGSFLSDLGESETGLTREEELSRFRVERSDGSSEIIDAVDEADAMRQSRNGYVGPAITVAVNPYTQIPVRRT